MQDAPDGDFQLEARFLSTPTVKNQMQGILVQEDADSWIRFDTYFDGTTAARLRGGDAERGEHQQDQRRDPR